MREPSARMRKNTVTFRRRSEPVGMRPTADTLETAVVTLSCSVQPLGDTGRRQDRFDEHERLGEISSYRLFVKHSDVLAAGLPIPFAQAADRVVFNTRPYSLRGEPVPQRHDATGEVLAWSLDIDGIK